MEIINIEKVQDIAFQIIAAVGEVKKYELEAVEYSKQGKYNEMNKSFECARKSYNDAHDFHFDIIQAEANGQSIPYSVLFSHAEDQLMSIESLDIFCKQLTDLYQRINERRI